MPVQYSGNITCIAKNDLGPSVPPSETRRLYVYDVPDGFGVKDEDKLWFWQGQNVLVQCYASIYDYKSVYWLGEDEEILNSMGKFKFYTSNFWYRIFKLCLNHEFPHEG